MPGGEPGENPISANLARGPGVDLQQVMGEVGEVRQVPKMGSFRFADDSVGTHWAA